MVRLTHAISVLDLATLRLSLDWVSSKAAPRELVRLVDEYECGGPPLVVASALKLEGGGAS
jgi:hypothetical protein